MQYNSLKVAISPTQNSKKAAFGGLIAEKLHFCCVLLIYTFVEHNVLKVWSKHFKIVTINF